MPPEIIHILRFCGRLAAQDFVMKCMGAGMFGGQWSGSSRVSYIIALSDWRSK